MRDVPQVDVLSQVELEVFGFAAFAGFLGFLAFIFVMISMISMISKPKQNSTKVTSILLSLEGCMLKSFFKDNSYHAARATLFEYKDLADCAADLFYWLI